jgi:Saxitoxin biosynthesis operon protein SxtJ
VRGHAGLASILALLALTIGPLGLTRPEWMRWIYVGWMVLAFPIGWMVSQVMLAVMFYGLFVPIGLIFRLLGRDPLHRARRPELKSYWAPKPAPADLHRYFKQF